MPLVNLKLLAQLRHYSGTAMPWLLVRLVRQIIGQVAVRSHLTCKLATSGGFSKLRLFIDLPYFVNLR